MYINLRFRSYQFEEEVPSSQTQGPSVFYPPSFEQMLESSGLVTRSLLGWLEDMRRSEADFNPELKALDLAGGGR